MKRDRSENGNGSAGVVGSLAEFGNNVANLAELQAKLAALDFKESVERALIPIAIGATGIALLLAALPVALLGVSALIVHWTAMHQGWAMLLTAGVALLVGGLTALAAGRLLPRAFQSFRRSEEEFARNISWIRTVLVHSGRPVPKRRW